MADPVTAAFRFGFGLPLPKGAHAAPEQMLSALSAPDAMAAAHPAPGLADLWPAIQEAEAARKTMAASTGADLAPAQENYRARLKALNARRDGAAKAAFARALDAPDGFRERLALFWTNHFTVTARRRIHTPLPSTLVEDAIRPNLSGRFPDLLAAAILHPAMLYYLDQTASYGPASAHGKSRGKGLNENLARELMELHTLGVGSGYSQDDVRELAELLTGLTVGKNGFAFSRKRAEPGPETVLDQSYEGESLKTVRRALQDLALRPETAAHIARKLAVHFVSPSPHPDLVAAMTAAYRQSEGDLIATYGALLTHPSAWQTPPQKARQPFEFMVAALRALGLTGADVTAMTDGAFRKRILTPMGPMGQPWQQAPGPDGWPEAAESWITPQAMAMRISWAMDVPARLADPGPDPAALLERALGPRASEALLWAVPKAESRREAVGLVLASPEFNRR